MRCWKLNTGKILKKTLPLSLPGPVPKSRSWSYWTLEDYIFASFDIFELLMKAIRQVSQKAAVLNQNIRHFHATGQRRDLVVPEGKFSHGFTKFLDFWSPHILISAQIPSNRCNRKEDPSFLGNKSHLASFDDIADLDDFFHIMVDFTDIYGGEQQISLIHSRIILFCRLGHHQGFREWCGGWCSQWLHCFPSLRSRWCQYSPFLLSRTSLHCW